jgi:hypothetical protein
MQPYQYALAAGIAWMVTLIILPFLIAKARRLAYARGFEDGKVFYDQALNLQLKEAKQAQADLRVELERNKQSCELQLAARQASIAALKASTTELQARIKSYTGMAVTGTDYEKLISTAETLRLAARTMALFKAQPHSALANTQAGEVEELAKRVHAHIRATPTAATITEAKV